MKYIKTFEVKNINEPRFNYNTKVKIKIPIVDTVYNVDYFRYNPLSKEFLYYITSEDGANCWVKESNLRFLNQLEKDMETYNL